MGDLILVADSHLRAEDEVTDQFLRFLRTEGPTAERVFLLGDIFDLWIARKALELPIHRALIETVSELRERGICVTYVQGNRDYFVADRYRSGPFVDVVEESLVVEHGGRQIHLSHGDLVNVRDRQYLAWRRFSRSGPVRALFGAIPSGAAARLSAYLERKFRTTNTAFRVRFPEEQAAEYAHSVFRDGPDTIVLGHFHEARTMDFEGGRKLFVLPGWREDRAYLRIDGSGVCRFADVQG